MGKKTKEMKDYRFDQRPLYGVGKDHDDNFWMSVFRQAILSDLVYKDIETYGQLSVTKEGQKFIDNPTTMTIALNHEFDSTNSDPDPQPARAVALDAELRAMLQTLRKKVADEKDLPPYVIFQDPSLDESKASTKRWALTRSRKSSK